VARAPGTKPTVYIGSSSGNFYALDARTGRTRWSKNLGGRIPGSATVVGEIVYVANLDTTVTDGFNVANGNKVWTFKDGAYNPVISDGHNLYLTGYKTVYRLKPRTAADVKRKAAKAGAKQKAKKKGTGKKKR